MLVESIFTLYNRGKGIKYTLNNKIINDVMIKKIITVKCLATLWQISITLHLNFKMEKL